MIERFQHVSVMLGRFFSNAIVWCSAVFFSALALLSLILSAHLFPGEYRLEFLWFQSPFVLILSALLFFVFVFLKKRHIFDKIRIRYFAAAVFAYVLVLGFLWIKVTRAWPEWDPALHFLAE